MEKSEAKINNSADKHRLNKWQHPRLANITTAVILIVMVAIGCFAYNISLGEYNEVRIFYPNAIKREYNLTMTEYSLDGTILQTKVIPKHLELYMALHTKSLSAQNPIHVQVVSGTITDVPLGTELPNTLLLFFPDSYNFPLEELSALSPNAGTLKIYWNPKEKRYEGNGNIMYQFESKGGYFLREPENLDKEYFHEIRSIDNPDRTTTKSFTMVGDVRRLVYNATEFPVESVSTTTNLKMNNIVQAISILVIDVGLVQSRKQIILGVACCYRNALRGKVLVIQKIRTLHLSNKS